ncbi:BA14K family protein [Breoghania sp. JC706]|uniref:BA14K family protein n=1 Tax=Breoghania sp. JC706 TaxID=3117732 RepID=UPI0030092717
MSALKKVATTTLSALAVTSMLAASTVTASAHDRGWYGGPRYDHYDRRDWRDHRRHHRDRGMDGAAAGLLGLGAGLILGGALASSANAAPPPPPPPPADYYDYGRYDYGPPRPWTSDWRAYCLSRYRSFNPSTGYFLGYDGEYHFCR